VRHWLNEQARQGMVSAFAVFALLFLTTFVLKGGRYSEFDLSTLCMNVFPLACVALGQYFVVLTNGIDLSVGPIMSVTGSIAALWLARNPSLAVALSLGIGLCAGLINATLVVKLALPPILATLASMSVYQGVALVILPSPGGNVPEGLTDALTGSVGAAPVALLLLLTMGFLTSWTMSTSFGLSLRAIGGDPAAARASGVRTQFSIFAAYVIAALLSSVGGIYLAIATASGSPTIGDGFILLSIAALVLGGAQISGGKGAPVGVVFGALTLIVIGQLLYFAQLSSFYQSLINGLILIGVVGFEASRGRLFSALREMAR
jgi:ribose transport system permease protein